MSDLSSNAQLAASSARPPERRRFPRIRCRLPVEISIQGNKFLIRGETVDVSLGGCYVSTMLPLPLGTEIDFRCWVASTPIDCKAVIRTSDPGVGTGIEFQEMDDLSVGILAYHLDQCQYSASEDGNDVIIRAAG